MKREGEKVMVTVMGQARRRKRNEEQCDDNVVVVVVVEGGEEEDGVGVYCCLTISI